MRQRTIVLFALLASILVVGSIPAGAYAGEKLVVGSQHSTDADFQNAQTLTNLSIVGSGESATVQFANTNGFETEPADAGTPEGFEAVGSGADSRAVVSSHAYTGSQSFYQDDDRADSDEAAVRPVSQPYTTARTVPVSVAIRQDAASSSGSTRLQLWEDGANIVLVGVRDGDLQYYDGSSWVVLSTTVDAGQWVHLTVRNIDASADTFDLEWSTKDGASGTETGLSTRNPVQTGYTSTYLESRDSAGYFDDLTVGGVPESATYVSASHTVENAEEAAINLDSVANASVDLAVEYHDGSQWVVAATDTVTTAGNHTVSGLPNDPDTWRVRVDVAATGDNPQFALADESILFTNHAPIVDDQSATPTGQLSNAALTLSIDASDPTFPTAQSDTVTGEFFVKAPSESTFTSVGTDTITSNGTLATSYTASSGGTYQWYVEVEDEYGGSATSSTFEFESPSNLTVRRETNPDNLISEATVNVTYYYGDEVISRQTSDGTVNLTGLPVDEPIIVLTSAPGYHTRAAVITDIYSQQNLYLLNESVESYNVVFDIVDPTGSYPRAETVLEVQRDVTLNNSTEWRTIAGDNFGAQGVVTDLEADERYRLVIHNLETNERSVLGAFTPVGSQTVTLQAETAQVNVSASSETAIGYEATRNDAGDAIVVEYADPGRTTSELKFMIHERYNESNVLLANQTFTGLGNVSFAQPLTADQQNKSWTVKYYWERTGEFEDGHARVDVGQGPRDLVPNILDDAWRVGAGILVLLITSLLFSELNLGVGIVTTAITGGILWYVGLLQGVTTGPAIVIALAAAGVVHYNQRGGL